MSPGLRPRQQAWGDRTVKATEPHPGQAPEIETPAHDLWLFVTTTEANRAQNAGDLAKAERIYRQIAASSRVATATQASESLAVSYHQLGMVAQQLAADSTRPKAGIRKHLAIRQGVGQPAALWPSSYHQLGRVAQDRGRLDEAEDWYKKSLAIIERSATSRAWP